MVESKKIGLHVLHLDILPQESRLDCMFYNGRFFPREGKWIASSTLGDSSPGKETGLQILQWEILPQRSRLDFMFYTGIDGWDTCEEIIVL